MYVHVHKKYICIKYFLKKFMIKIIILINYYMFFIEVLIIITSILIEIEDFNVT